MPIATTLLLDFESEIAPTRRALECVPAPKADWKPHEKSMSLGSLAAHIAATSVYATRMLTGGDQDMATEPFGPEDYTTTEALLATFDTNFAACRNALIAADDEYLQASWRLLFKGRVVFDLPRAEVFRTYTTHHLIHHRGQLTVYFRLLDIPVPGFYGPSADEHGT